MDLENRAYYWSFLNTIFKNIVYVCKRNVSLRFEKETSPETSLLSTQNRFDRKKLIMIIFGGSYIILPTFLSFRLRYFKINPLDLQV